MANQRHLLIASLLLIGSVLLVELTGFSQLFIQSKQLLSLSDAPPSISIFYELNNTTSSTSSESASAPSSSDWFDGEQWPKQYCPYYENVCIYNQRLYMSDKADEFRLRENYPQKVFGDHMPNIQETLPIYAKVMNSTSWDHARNEQEHAQCRFDSVTNHMVVQGFFQTMLGEWYTRVLAEMFKLYNSQRYHIEQDVKLYLFIGDQAPLYTSHHLFMQPFSNYNLQHFTSLIERIDCRCMRRLIFCGFKREYDETLQKTFLTALDRMTLDNRDAPSLKRNGRTSRNIELYPSMLAFYNEWVNAHDMNIQRDVRQWKLQALQAHESVALFDGNVDVDDWFFIGFYQRTYRRTWLGLETDILVACNEKYNALKIYCGSINLEGHMHPRDVLVMHRSHDMLIGIHGAHLTDAIWLYDPDRADRHKYIIELLPVNGPTWTSSVNMPTALGVIFWQSQLNHVGLKLHNESITEKDWNRGKSRWYKSDFNVRWDMLTDVIDFLIVDGDGGYCAKYDHNASDIKVPAAFAEKGYEFAIYNAYCNGKSNQTWNYVLASNQRDADKCHTCLPLIYDNIKT